MTAQPETARLRTALAEPAPREAFVPPAGAVRQVCVHLTPLAPGLDGRNDVSDDDRWLWLSWLSPSATLRHVLRRLQRRADQVTLRWFDSHDGIEVHAGTVLPDAGRPTHSDIVGHISRPDGVCPPEPGCARLLAIIFGVSPVDVAAAHAALIEPQRSAA